MVTTRHFCEALSLIVGSRRSILRSWPKNSPRRPQCGRAHPVSPACEPRSACVPAGRETESPPSPPSARSPGAPPPSARRLPWSRTRPVSAHSRTPPPPISVPASTPAPRMHPSEEVARPRHAHWAGGLRCGRPP
eukprot:scaffold2331_cov252-Pinguiococcus_pyrenoidosus.AAC.14